MQPTTPKPLRSPEELSAKRDEMHARAVGALKRVWEVPGLTAEQRGHHARGLNDQLRNLEYDMQRGHLASWPRTIELPVAGNCNLRCEMCSLSHGAPTYAFWTTKDIEPFDKLFKYASLINPTGVGEPLMGRDFFPMIETFKRHGSHVGFFTNGTLLNEKKADRLIELGVDYVNVSIDGATAETFEQIRKPAKFEVVVGNVRRLIARRRERGAAKPLVQLAIVLMGENIHELPDLVRLAAELGADSVYGMFVSKGGPSHQPRLPQKDPRRTNEFLREARLVGDELGIRIWIPALLEETKDSGSAAVPPGEYRPASIEGKVYCAYPWNQYLVHNDGSVGPCCKLRGEIDGLPLGHIKDGTPEMHWNSPGMVRLRERLLRNDPPPMCRNCSLRTAAIS